MSAVRLPPLADLVRQRDVVAGLVKRLDDRMLAELRRRAGAPVGVLVRTDDGDLVRDMTGDRPLEEGGGPAVVDGFGTGSGGGPRGSDVSTPTEGRVVAAAGGRWDAVAGVWTADTWEAERDPVLEELGVLFGQLGDLADIARSVDRRFQHILAIADGRRGRESSLQGDCQACERPVAGTSKDRLRAGYCDACYVAWRRWSGDETIEGRDPDRVRFERWRRMNLRRRGGGEQSADETAERRGA